MRTASIAALGVLVLLAGCDNRSGDAAKSETSRTTQAPNAVQPSRLELRPVLALFPPEGQEFEGDDVVLSARSDTGAPLRYAVGPVALTGRDFVSAKAEHVAIPDLWVVVLRPTPAGVAKMNRLAQAGYDRQPPQNSVAIVVDGVVQSAPSSMNRRSTVTSRSRAT